MDDLKAKQQVVEKIKSSANILITVSDNPTVDALSAAVGLTMLFDKLGKYSTAIFSGVVPPAIAFLEPQKVLEDTTDSLRDFIIALDKEKADHLRYKVEGDSVKIFITPYKTTITSEDLVFNQGDYNVELVIALGVDDRDHLDKALEAHGQIFHDAAVITMTANDQTSTLGGIDWHDQQASSLSEMVTTLAESLKKDKKSLIDPTIATAFLTGLVAQTERFSNRYTSPQAMTIASSLMAAGADQQLIATKLQEAAEAPEEEPEVEEEEVPQDTADHSLEEDGTLRINDHSKKEDEPTKESEPTPEPEEEPESKDPSLLGIKHDDALERKTRQVKEAESKAATAAAYDALEHESAPDPIADPVEEPEPIPEPIPEPEFVPEPTPEPAPEASEEPAKEPSLADLDAAVRKTNGQSRSALDDLIDDSMTAAPRDLVTSSPSSTAELPPPVAPVRSPFADQQDAPLMGGALNATTEQAAEDARREEERDRNKTLLSHGAVSQAAPVLPPLDTPFIESQPTDLPVPPSPLDLGLPLPPPLPDFGTPQTTGAYAPEASQPEILGDILAPEAASQSAYFAPPAGAQVPGFIPQEQSQPNPAPQQSAPVPADPGQFKIPGQQ